MPDAADPSEHLFRHEAGRMVASLVRLFGPHNLALAEDVVQEAFCRALETWKLQGLPPNPAGWLMTTAKRKALDALRRERTARTFAPELARMLASEWTLAPAVDALLEPQAIQDDDLRMMFTCCHPRLAEPAQVALILHLLCGFSVPELAQAFLATPAALEKRLGRAKKVLAASKRLFDLGRPAQLVARLPAVHRALYLLFNEGFHGAHPEHAVREELCQEAIRLTRRLLDHPFSATPATHALLALQLLNSARQPGRLGRDGRLQALDQQDRGRWHAAQVEEGLTHLGLSAQGAELSVYHLEGAIAAQHASAPRPEATDWAAIVALYDLLLNLRPSPVVGLQRAIALAQRDGAEAGLEALHRLEGRERLARYPFYAAALGELERRRGRLDVAREHLSWALGLARNPEEQAFLGARLEACAAV